MELSTVFGQAFPGLPDTFWDIAIPREFTNGRIRYHRPVSIEDKGKGPDKLVTPGYRNLVSHSTLYGIENEYSWSLASHSPSGLNSEYLQGDGLIDINKVVRDTESNEIIGVSTYENYVYFCYALLRRIMVATAIEKTTTTDIELTISFDHLVSVYGTREPTKPAKQPIGEINYTWDTRADYVKLLESFNYKASTENDYELKYFNDMVVHFRNKKSDFTLVVPMWFAGEFDDGKTKINKSRYQGAGFHEGYFPAHKGSTTPYPKVNNLELEYFQRNDTSNRNIKYIFNGDIGMEDRAIITSAFTQVSRSTPFYADQPIPQLENSEIFWYADNYVHKGTNSKKKQLDKVTSTDWIRLLSKFVKAHRCIDDYIEALRLFAYNTAQPEADSIQSHVYFDVVHKVELPPPGAIRALHQILLQGVPAAIGKQKVEFEPSTTLDYSWLFTAGLALNSFWQWGEFLHFETKRYCTTEQENTYAHITYTHAPWYISSVSGIYFPATRSHSSGITSSTDAIFNLSEISIEIPVDETSLSNDLDCALGWDLKGDKIVLKHAPTPSCFALLLGSKGPMAGDTLLKETFKISYPKNTKINGRLARELNWWDTWNNSVYEKFMGNKPCLKAPDHEFLLGNMESNQLLRTICLPPEYKDSSMAHNYWVLKSIETETVFGDSLFNSMQPDSLRDVSWLLQPFYAVADDSTASPEADILPVVAAAVTPEKTSPVGSINFILAKYDHPTFYISVKNPYKRFGTKTSIPAAALGM